MPDVDKEWKYDPTPLLNSPRKVSGVFHKAVVDKDGEMITSSAIRKSIPDYMHLPALHDFHKERPVGLATKVWENSDGSFGFEGVIKATEDCDDVWDKIKKGNYDHVSIFGKREEGNNNCSLPAPLRSGACITTGVRLDSISVCDNNARNDATSLEVRKGMMIVDVDELRKAETTDGELQHASTDYAKEKKCGTKCKRRITVEKADIEKAPRKQPDEWMKRKGRQDSKTFPPNPGGRSGNPASERSEGTAPSVENFTERNERVEVLKEGISDKAKNMTAEAAKKQVDRPKIGRSLGVRKAEESIPPEDKNKKISGIREPNERDKKAPWAKKPAFDKAEVEKGDKKKDNWQKEAFDKLEEEAPGVAADYRLHEQGGEKGKRQYFKKGDAGTDEWEKENEGLDDTNFTKIHPLKHLPAFKNKLVTERGHKRITDWKNKIQSENVKKGDDEDDTMTEPVKKSKKAKLEPEEPEKFEEPETEEEDEDESLEEEEDESEEKPKKPTKEVEKAEEEEVEKGEFDRQPLKHLDGKSLHQELKEGLKGKGSAKTAKHSQHNARIAREGRANQKRPGMSNNEVYADDAASGLKHMTKAGETMEEEYEEQEFITKAMVPIEEIDTIVKARTEEISKAYIAQFDEIKKAYDAKFAELTSKVEKMENETIRKGGQIVVIPQLMGSDGTGSMSNADALARMQAGR